MATSNQAPDLEGIHRKIHDIAEQIGVMNKLNACLVQHLTQILAPATVLVSEGSN